MNTTKLVARFSTLKNSIQLHVSGCSLVSALKVGAPVAAVKGATIYPWTGCEASDAVERGLKVTTCKCAR